MPTRKFITCARAILPLLVLLSTLHVSTGHAARPATQQPARSTAEQAPDPALSDFDPANDHGELAGAINTFKESLRTIKSRYIDFTTHLGPEIHTMTATVRLLLSGEAQQLWVLGAIALLFAIGLVFFLLVKQLLRRRYEALTRPGSMSLPVRLGRLSLLAGLDFICLFVFSAVVVTLFFIFTEGYRIGRLIFATYFIASLIVMGVHLSGRFILAPRTAHLRLLPLSDHEAQFYFRWLIVIAGVAALGWLTCGFIRINLFIPSLHLAMIGMIGLMISLMLIIMIQQQAGPIAAKLRANAPEHSLRRHMAGIWHQLATAYVIVFWCVWMAGLIIFGHQLILPAVATLVSIPIFLCVDWLVQHLLTGLFTYIDKDQSADRPQDGPSEATGPLPPQPCNQYENRAKAALSASLRWVTVAVLFFWLIGLWGIELPLGKTVSRALLSILLTILTGYIVWQLIKLPIERKLREELPDEDEEMEEGGSGGSRIGTLLLLLKKFLAAVLLVMVVLVALASLGINIGPLIAGAGIVGVAIGFGAQTLVKDIISGVFFLIDDAFRVGDYVDTGVAKGMVEHISLRSFRLRHPRGMVHTIPFGDISSVTNYSRDYIITKLDVRVPFDTDIDLVRKVVKKIYNEFLNDENLAPKLLGKLKSQGVRELDDSALVIRVKFKSVPGEQFILRREVFRRLQEGFKEKGIEFAARKVHVALPNDTGTPQIPREILQEAGAAAATLQNDSTRPDKR